MGSFAKEKIARGEYISTLTGAPHAESGLWEKCDSFGISENDPLQIEDNLFLVLDYPSKTINHSCDPNAGLRNVSDLYAIRDINVDEEITYDYSTTTGTNDTLDLNCHCGAKNCRKMIGNVLSLPPQVLAKYIALNVLQDFIKQQLLEVGKLEMHS